MKSGRVDIWIAALVTILLMVGFFMVFSASSMLANSRHGSLTYYFFKQLIWGILAVSAMIGFSKLDYRKLLGHKVPLFGVMVSIALLLGLYAFGITRNGATRWYGVFGVYFQPSEFTRLALIIYFAYFLASRGENRLNKIQEGLLPLMIIFVVNILLIMFQPDLSTALMIVLICGSLLFVSPVKLKYMAAMAMFLLPAAVFVMTTRSYPQDRINAWYHAFENPLSASYQIRQSLIGLGRGGLFGQGIGQSKQKLFFLPDSHTDFIFSIIGEEAGFIGTTLVLSIFLIILYRGVKIASNADDVFGRYLAVGITLSLVYYAFINVAVVTMLLPATGLPMPFVSYGGSHLLFMGIAVGILLNISRQNNAETGGGWQEDRQRRRALSQLTLSSD